MMPDANDPAPVHEARVERSIIHRIVHAALDQPLLVLLLSFAVIVGGIWSFSRLPVDAYPDLSPTRVELVTQWPGHAAEEVERLITVPLETEMNGVERVKVERSVSLYGLSNIKLTFVDGTDNYFARQRVFERIAGASLPDGVAPDVSPLFSPNGLIYRYVLESPDRSAMELKILNDWVLERAFKSVPGVADMSGLGGETMEYHIVVDPIRLAGAGLGIGDVSDALGKNNANAGGGFYTSGGQFFYVRGLGRLATLEDIGNVVLAVQNGTPVTVKDIGRVEIGHAPRLGQFGFNDRDDAVEGVVLMRTGEQAQVVLKRVQAKARELNESILPKDVIAAHLLRSQRPDRAHHEDGRGEPGPRDRPRRRGADLLPVRRARRADRRRDDPAGPPVRLHLSRPQEHPGEPALDRGDRLRHPGRRRRGDGGEHLPPARRATRDRVFDQGGHRRGRVGGRPTDRVRGGGHRRRLPSHLRPLGTVGEALHPDGRHDDLRPRWRAGPRAHAPSGALRLGPARWGARAAQPGLRGDQALVCARPRLEPGPRAGRCRRRRRALRRGVAAGGAHRRRVHAAPGRRGALGARDDAVHHLARGVGQDRPADPRRAALVPRGHRRRLRTRPPGRRCRPDRLLQRRVLRRAQAVRRMGRTRTTPRPS